MAEARKPILLGKCRSFTSTDKAIKVRLDDERGFRWVPQDCIHDDSEVFEGGQTGKLVIIDGSWWARKEGFCD